MIDEAKVAAGKGITERAVCRRLRRLAREVPADQVVVELGAYQGRTTAWLALGASEGHQALVYSVDPWDLLTPDDYPDYAADQEPGYAEGRYASLSTRHAYEMHLEACGLIKQVRPVRRFAAQAGKVWFGPPVGLLFHDAAHTADAVEADLRAWEPHIAPGGWVVLHDAGDARVGVLEGAARVLNTPGWQWRQRKLRRWKQNPDRRGALYVRRSP